FNDRFAGVAPAPSQTLSQALGMVGANIVGNTATIAQELFGVTPAAASQVGLTVSPSRHTTTDANAFNAYSIEVAPPVTAREAAISDWNAAFDRNDAAAMAAADAALEAADRQIDSLQASYFGTP